MEPSGLFSIHTSAFNLSRAGIDWLGALRNWESFLGLCGGGEIVVTVNKSDDDTYERLAQDWFHRTPLKDAKLVTSKFSYEDPEFDGKIKNKGYKECKNPICMLMDLDEWHNLDAAPKWVELGKAFLSSPADGLLVPTIDTYKNLQNYKSAGYKWYMVKNKPNIMRGTYEVAKTKGGDIDITKSDTTEPIYKETGLLVSSLSSCGREFLEPQNIHLLEGQPFVIHRGWENAESRIVRSNFWHPIWENRKGESFSQEIQNISDYEKVEHWSLPLSFRLS